MIRDEILVYNNLINTYCTACKKFRHSINECPWMHIKKLKTIIIKKYQFYLPQERNPKFERKEFKENAFAINKVARLKLKKIRQTIVRQVIK
jgi:hypothetical protein